MESIRSVSFRDFQSTSCEKAYPRPKKLGKGSFLIIYVHYDLLGIPSDAAPIARDEADQHYTMI